MLDKESIDTYRSIHLDRDLRCVILTRHESRRNFSTVRLLRPVCALASVSLIAAVLFFYHLPSSPALSVNGDAIGRKAVAISTENVEYKGTAMRTMSILDAPSLQTAQNCIALEISAGHDVYVSINGAVLLLPDADGIPTFVGQSCDVSAGKTVFIPLAGLENSSPVTLSLSDLTGKSLQTYEIYYNNDAQSWYIRETQNK